VRKYGRRVGVDTARSVAHAGARHPIHLTDEQVTEFQRIYLEAFGVSLSREDAIGQGLKLVGLVRALGTRASRSK
jgi:hypothetical protein